MFNRVLELARLQADQLDHNFIGTEHLLLGIISLGKGVAINVLKASEVEPVILRVKLLETVSVGPEQPKEQRRDMGSIPFTPRSKKVFSMANKEAKSLGHDYIGTEHLLLGLLREGDGVAAKVLRSMNINLEDVKTKIIEMGKSASRDETSSKQPPPAEKVELCGKQTFTADEIACKLLRINPDGCCEPARVALINAQLAFLLINHRSSQLPYTSMAGLQKFLVETVIPTTISLEMLNSVASFFSNLDEREHVVGCIRRCFEATKCGSMSEKNFGTVLQLMTGKPVERSVTTVKVVDFVKDFTNPVQAGGQ